MEENFVTKDNTDLVHLCHVKDIFIPYMKSALARLEYLYSDICFVFEGGSIYVRSTTWVNYNQVKSEAMHILYREKVLKDTWHLRETIYSRVFER